MQEDAFENVVCKMMSISSGLQCVKPLWDGTVVQFDADSTGTVCQRQVLLPGGNSCQAYLLPKAQ